jgi:hypothetical protein
MTMRLISRHPFAQAGWATPLAVIVAAVSLGASADAVASNRRIPLQGAFQVVEQYDYQFPTLFVDGAGSGIATHLGRFTVNYEHVVDLPTLAGTGTAQFIAANGDRLFTEVTGQANPTEDPDVAYIEETYTILGGTGRFAGATGGFTVRRLLNTVTGDTFGFLKGNLIKR